VKNIVYHVKINDIQHLRARIRDALATVTLNTLQATWDERSNMVWIFVVPSGEPTLKFIESYVLRRKL
jgi:hypothetical protein